jgi:hypothetical protein
MTKFRKIWNDETNGFILSHKEMTDDYKAFYNSFMTKFPDSRVTYIAFKNQCSRLKICKKTSHNLSRKTRPLYSEQIKKGYVRIKIAQPNVWVSKAKWVYMETHPWEDFTERSNYIFLDGDARNFSRGNIGRVPLRLMAIFNNLGGCEVGNPEITRLRILMAKEKYLRFEVGEKLGLVANGGGGRLFKAERNARQRRYNQEAKKDKERMARKKETLRKYLEKCRQNPEWVEKKRRYAREWQRRNRKNGK